MNLKKLMFWKKEDDFDDFGVDNQSMGNSPDLGMRGPGLDNQMNQELESNIGLDRPQQQYPSSQYPSFDNQNTQNSQYAQRQQESFGMRNQFSQPQNNQQHYSISKELEIISSKLDTIKSYLENLNQRLTNLERSAYGKKSNFYNEMPPRTY